MSTSEPGQPTTSVFHEGPDKKHRCPRTPESILSDLVDKIKTSGSSMLDASKGALFRPEQGGQVHTLEEFLMGPGHSYPQENPSDLAAMLLVNQNQPDVVVLRNRLEYTQSILNDWQSAQKDIREWALKVGMLQEIKEFLVERRRKYRNDVQALQSELGVSKARIADLEEEVQYLNAVCDTNNELRTVLGHVLANPRHVDNDLIDALKTLSTKKFF
ncbi:hypothetical protein V5O48_012858 [Marasmius crinis-equi]|uniref:Uncharacterized protein n=1 Tax=Marasmius crinis-equi TaxID=585013 RepID=A0ABR3F214_9AGAR